MRDFFSHVNGTSLDIDMQQRFHAGCNRSYNSALGAFVRCRPEVDILPGKTWKCSMRSAFYWFAEFCHSQRLSHFAASFIVTRAEGSIAKSCKNRCYIQQQKNSRFVRNRLSTGSCVTQWREWQPPSSQSTSVSRSFMRSQWDSGLKLDYLSCKWSFRRFTYGNLVTTSPSSKW